MHRVVNIVHCRVADTDTNGLRGKCIERVADKVERMKIRGQL